MPVRPSVFCGDPRAAIRFLCEAAGAEIIEPPETQFFGARTYRARDPGGHVWAFSMHVRDVPVPEMEQALGRDFKNRLD